MIDDSTQPPVESRYYWVARYKNVRVGGYWRTYEGHGDRTIPSSILIHGCFVTFPWYCVHGRFIVSNYYMDELEKLVLASGGTLDFKISRHYYLNIFS